MPGELKGSCTATFPKSPYMPGTLITGLNIHTKDGLQGPCSIMVAWTDPLGFGSGSRNIFMIKVYVHNRGFSTNLAVFA